MLAKMWVLNINMRKIRSPYYQGGLYFPQGLSTETVKAVTR